MKKRNINETQREILTLLADHPYEEMTIRDMQSRLNLSSTSLVSHHLRQLQKKRYIKKDPNLPVKWVVVGREPEKEVEYLPLFGNAFCGISGEILDDYCEERVPIASKMLSFPASEGFMVRAQGDSMEPKIYENDYIIARKTQSVDSGRVAVCVYEGETLVKKIQYEKACTLLISLNPKYAPIIAENHLRIVGEVKNIMSQEFAC